MLKEQIQDYSNMQISLQFHISKERIRNSSHFKQVWSPPPDEMTSKPPFL